MDVIHETTSQILDKVLENGKLQQELIESLPSTPRSEITENVDSTHPDTNRRVSIATVKRKTNSITTDISNGSVWKYTEGSKDAKLTGTQKQLKDEKFDNSIYSTQSGFKTKRPDYWAEKLEARMKSTVGGVWEYELNEENIIVGCKVVVYFELTKTVIIKISFRKGVFMVTGTNYLDWIATEFPAMNPEVENPTANQNHAETPGKATKDVRAEKELSELEKDILAMNENIESNRNANAILESSVLKLAQTLSIRNAIDEEKQKKLDEKFKELEKKYDDKLTLYAAECEKEFSRKVKETTKSLDAKITNLKVITGTLKLSLQKQIESLTIKTPHADEDENVDDKKRRDETREHLETVTQMCKEIKLHHTEIIELKKEHEEKMFSSIGFKPVGVKQAQVTDDKVVQTPHNIDLTPTFNTSNPHVQPPPPPPPPPQQQQQQQQKQPQQQQQQQLQYHQQQQQQQHQQQKQQHDQSAQTSTSKVSNENRADQQIDLLVFMDSNRRHIKWRQFWTLKGTEKYFCGQLVEVEKRFREETAKSIKHILIHVGVNDLDTRTPEQVTQHIKVIISGMRKKFVGVKIVMSEITPRNDERDIDVIRCNELLQELYKNEVDVTIAPHSNLRDDNWSMFDDSKHVTEAAVPRLVSNIKRALRKSYGITADGSKPKHTKQQQPLADRLQKMASYNDRTHNEKQVSHVVDPNIVLMQLAQLLRLVEPS